jgi:hypothetical protein
MSYQVDRKRWSGMTIFDQMGNIYSEVGRSFNAREAHNQADCDRAVGRAIDLFDATVTGLIERKSPQAKEVLRAKEEYLNAIYDPSISNDDIKSLDAYFMHYAIAARLK